MGKNAWFTLIAFILFAVGGVWFYLNKVKQVGVLAAEDSQPTIESSIDYSIVFAWNEAEPMNGNTFQEVKDQLLQDLAAGGQLEIIGYYDVNEQNNSVYMNLGEARAHATAGLFPELSESQIVYRSEETMLDSTEDYFQATRLNVIFGHTHPETDTLNTEIE